jgi:hypothetical protein
LSKILIFKPFDTLQLNNVKKVSDWYGPYSSSSKTNPTGASSELNSMLGRTSQAWPFNRYNGTGFRLVCEPE